MQIYLKKIFGDISYTFVAEGKNLFDAVMEAQNLSFKGVPCCGICGSKNLSLGAHIAQGKYKYVHVNCDDCRARLTFGQRKDSPDTFFLRRNAQKEYDWQAYQDPNQGPQIGPGQHQSAPRQDNAPPPEFGPPQDKPAYTDAYIALADALIGVNTMGALRDWGKSFTDAADARKITLAEWEELKRMGESKKQKLMRT